MSSALRNAVKRKTHKERSQPSERKRLGLLEKKKDYVLRARDYHKKEDAINALKRKAAYRNPDEFYFAMQRSKTEDGVHVARSSEQNKYTEEELRVMKTQDVKYVQLKAGVEAKRVEKMKKNLHGIGIGDKRRKHTVFVDTEEEAKNFDAAEHFDTAPELVGRSFNRPRKSQLEAEDAVVGVRNQDGGVGTSAGIVPEISVKKTRQNATRRVQDAQRVRRTRQKAQANVSRFSHAKDCLARKGTQGENHQDQSRRDDVFAL